MASLRRAMANAHRILNYAPTATRRSIAATTTPLLRSQHGYGLFSRFTSQSTNSQSPDIDFSSEESKRRLFNRLIYRSKQRGFLELDLVLGKWVEEHIHSMDESGIKALVNVLDLENPDLWKWLTGQEQPPEAVNTNPVFTAVREKVTTNLDSHAAPETRAIPGQSWVRGWDDIKKGRDSPVAGNQ
ncbi:Succinate dehydrogenase assembly factor 2, mitochondrial [Quillaja saponaria]|uniref:Succinate dehydrogenase assembly factor 2, mitochondrial n=1 Tax=Quillaja saponaria TaxID=32244 RepID=A0AAD7LFA7_QUISA|nr:Succinate dehydrogenase assembly factor 2, mitochondrial [Quillaja saponaria]